jgi:hypothetical protein
VGQFVGERADLLVARSVGDDDLAALRITPTAGPVLGEVADLNAVVQLDGVGDERGDQVAVAVAGDRFCGRGERDGLPAGQRVGHRDVEDRDGAEEDLLLAGVLAVLVALLDGEGGEDADRLLALADAAVAIEEGAEAGDVGRRDAAVVALDRDQHLVSEAVPREAVAGANLDPALPAVGAQQGAGGLFDAVAVGLVARVALLVGERRAVEAAGHGGLLRGLGARPVAGRSPVTRTPVRACHHRVAVSARRRAAPATRRRRGPRRARRRSRRRCRARPAGARRAAARGPGPRPSRRRRGRA